MDSTAVESNDNEVFADSKANAPDSIIDIDSISENAPEPKADGAPEAELNSVEGDFEEDKIDSKIGDEEDPLSADEKVEDQVKYDDPLVNPKKKNIFVKVAIMVVFLVMTMLLVACEITSLVVLYRSKAIPHYIATAGFQSITWTAIHDAALAQSWWMLLVRTMGMVFISAAVWFDWTAILWKGIGENVLRGRNEIFKASLFMGIWSFCAVAALALLKVNLGFGNLSEPVEGMFIGALVAVIFVYIGRHMKPAQAVFVLVAFNMLGSIVKHEMSLHFATFFAQPLNHDDPKSALLIQVVEGWSEKFAADNIYIKKDTRGFKYNAGITGENIIIGSIDYDAMSDRHLAALGLREMGNRMMRTWSTSLIVSIARGIGIKSVALLLIYPSETIFASMGFNTMPIIGALPIAQIIAGALDEVLRPLVLSQMRKTSIATDRVAFMNGWGKHLAEAYPIIASNANKVLANVFYAAFNLEEEPILNRIEILKDSKQLNIPKA